MAEQRRLLRHILGKNRKTRFGKQYGFANLSSVESFRRTVPIQSYEDCAPYIDLIRQGKTNVLTAERVRYLEPTSGSSGPFKLIPYTSSLQKSFQKALYPWLLDIFLHHPRLFFLKSYWLITPRVPLDVASMVPVGFANDTDYLGFFSKFFARHTLISPAQGDNFCEAIKHCFEENKKSLGLISIWSPSMLEALFQGDTVTLPHLQLVSGWGDASAQCLTPLVKKYFPNTPFQPKGLLSTECIASFPLAKTKNAPILAYRSHFFEFMDESGETLCLDRVVAGKEYTLIVTTQGGLYRYNTKDRVKITGFYKKIPTIQFLGRNAVCDFHGEKLHEASILRAMRNACAQHAVTPTFQGMSFEKDSYILFVDCPADIDLSPLEVFLEEELQRNYHYKNCRLLHQLQPARVRRVHEALEQYTSHCLARGQRLGDIKILPFNPVYSDIFRDLPCQP